MALGSRLTLAVFPFWSVGPHLPSRTHSIGNFAPVAPTGGPLCHYPEFPTRTYPMRRPRAIPVTNRLHKFLITRSLQ
ncbi:hypothetical protein BC826DRAFT_995139 [Russula brevipes]|nr:hypothetical protein BC826DRAFT_995139 [Russula brevipes]